MSNESDNSSHLLMGRTYAWAESSKRNAETPQKSGLFQLLKINYTIIVFPLFGLVCTIGAFLFTLWFGSQTFKCPSWANDCKETATIFVNNYGLVQGIVSTVHGIGMGAIAYAAYAFGSSALWPILHERPYRLNNIDTYLAATHGSIPALVKAILEFFGARGLMILPFVMFAAILVQVDAAIVGIAFTRQNVTQEFSSNYSLGGGVGLSYKQLNPPGQLPGSITDAMSLYASWSKDLAKEPLPQLRDFFMDRDKIQELGDMSAKALKIQKDITCTGRLLDIDGKLKTESDTKTLRIKTNFPANEETDKDNLVTIRLQPRLTLWVDNIVYKSNSNAISTIIFASINGDIENGSKTLSTPEMKAAGNYTNGISAVACNVDVKLVDSNFSIGEGCSSLSTVSRFGSISSGSGKLDNRHVAAWFGLAAVTNGVSVYGAQPMFNNKDKGLPSMFTSISNATDTQKRWTIDQLKEFINVSSGALAITMSRQSADEKVILHSRKETLQLDPMRAYILLAPPIALLILILLLVVTVVWFYRKDRIPNMCLVQVGDLVAFTQTSDISVNARTASGTNKDSSKLGEMKVKYGITNEGQVGLGCPETVSSFD